MDFFTKSDWFGREGSFLYAPEYLVFFAVVVAVAIILPLWLRKRSAETARRVMIAMWAFALVYDILRWSVGWIDTAIDADTFHVGSALPLHTCSTFWYTAPLALFLKEGRLKRALCSYLCTINLFGGIVGMFVGTAMMGCYSFFSFYGMEHMVYHAIVIIMPVIMLVTGYYKPRGREYLGGLAVFGAIALPTYIFDTIFAVDYMYIYDGLTLPPFLFIAEAVPHRLVWTAIALVGYFLIALLLHYIAVGVSALYRRYARKNAAE